MKLDNVDKKIIEQLRVNGRSTLQEISKKTGYTSMGIKKRLDKLIKSGVIKVTALMNVSKMKLYPALVFLEFENAEDMRNIIEKFEKCPRVVKIFTSLGGYNLIALVVAEDQDTLECISMEKCSMRSQKGIRRSEFFPIVEVYYTPYMDIDPRLKQDTDKPPCGVDCKNCVRYKEEKCVACPITTLYRGNV